MKGQNLQLYCQYSPDGVPIAIEMKVETKHIEGLPADLAVRNAVKAEASAQAGSEFIIQLPIV